MAKFSFNNKEQPFFKSLKISVDEYFAATGFKKTGNRALHAKALVLLPLAVVLYLFLLLGNYNIVGGIALCVALGLAMVSIAFNVMHDACHGSYSGKKWVNETLGLTMNALGGNAFIWKLKHNIVHHTYTNVDGMDDDIVKSPLLRHCPTQQWKPAHRYQFVYMFLLYSLSTILWVYLTDMLKYFSKKVVVTDMKMTVKEHIIFWGSKALYVLFYVALPIACVGWGPWLAGYLIANATMGLALSVVFQLAHVVEKTSFEEAGTLPKTIDREWAIYEVMATSNFATSNKIVSWFAGGLNFQVEHHLFPRISHVHYPALSKIVKEKCDLFDVPYHCYKTMAGALASHIRLMKLLGKKEGVAQR